VGKGRRVEYGKEKEKGGKGKGEEGKEEGEEGGAA
jgi:hypothetical protein